MALKVDVVIIGAGWYGLVAARTYLRLRPDINLVIIDSDTTVGGVWSQSRLYENLVAQVNLGLFNYVDTPMPSLGTNADGQVTGRMIHDYLQNYAEKHDLLRRIRFGQVVQKVEKSSSGWQLSLRGDDTILIADKLLVATGVTSIPSLPKYEEQDVQIPVIHSRDLGQSYDELQQEKYRHVIVVGAAKSAYDAVYLVLTMGKKVTWIIRPDGAGPLAILPSRLLGYWTSIGVASTRLMTCLSPSILNTQGFLFLLLQRTTLGRWLTSKFWDIVAHLSDLHAGYDQGDHVAGLRPEIPEKSVFWANSGLGVVTLPDFWKTIHEGDVKVVRDELMTLERDKMSLKSGQAVRADFAVMCTGWGDHFAFFDDKMKSQLGLPETARSPCEIEHSDRDWEGIDRDAGALVDDKLPLLAQGPFSNTVDSLPSNQRHWRLYRRVIPLEFARKGDRSLAILGQIHTVQTPLVASIQTFWAIVYLLGELDLPGDDTMVDEIAAWNAWTRKRYASQGRKLPYSLYDFLPYVDTLCNDLGINPYRKPNLLAEWLSPYRPEDYDGFIDEYFAKRDGGSKSRVPLFGPTSWALALVALCALVVFYKFAK